MYTERMKGYEVTKDGRVISRKRAYETERELKQCKQGKGYLQVSVGGKSTVVHRLVAWKHVEGYKEGLTVNHIDGNKTNNDSSNLEWIDVRDNCIHAMKYISTKRRLYTDEQIREIRTKFSLWKTNKDRRYTSVKLGIEYGVSKVTIMNIINGDRYSYVE